MFKKLAALFAGLTAFASVSKLFAFIPGGQAVAAIGSIIGSLVNLVVRFFRWLLIDIEDAFKEPQRFMVRLVCILAALGGGFYSGVRHDAGMVNEARQETQVWKTAHAKLVTGAKKVDAEAKSTHEKGVQAMKKAESDEKAKIAAESKVAPLGLLSGPVADTGATTDNSVRPSPKRAARHCDPNSRQALLQRLMPFAKLNGCQAG